MIIALDHLVLRASFVAGAVGACATLFGRRAEKGRLQLGNVALVIEDEPSTAHLSALVFATGSLEKTARLLERRGVPTARDGDRLVLSGSSGEALSISPYTGEILSRIALPSRSHLSPVIAGGTIYFLSDDAELMALR